MENKDLENWISRVEARVMALEADKLTDKPADYSLVFQSIRNQIDLNKKTILEVAEVSASNAKRLNLNDLINQNQAKINARLLELLKKPEAKTSFWFRK